MEKAGNINFAMQFLIIYYIQNILKNFHPVKRKHFVRPVRFLNMHTFDILCSKMPAGTADLNATVVISLKLALQLSVSSGSWMIAKFSSQDIYQETICYRWVKVCVDLNLRNDRCFISLILFHNLQQRLDSQDLQIELSREQLIYNIFLVTRLYTIYNANTNDNLKHIISNYKSSLSPKLASKMNLSIVNLQHIPSNEEIEKVLHCYFNTEKYVEVGDVLAVPLTVPQSFWDENLQSVIPPKYIYFSVISINENSIIASNKSNGSLVTRQKTSLYLDGNQNLKVPYLIGGIETLNECVPPCMLKIFTKICDIAQSYNMLSTNCNLIPNCTKFEKESGSSILEDNLVTNKEANLYNTSSIFKETFPTKQLSNSNGQVLLIGPSGSGKTKIINLLAQNFSYYIKWIDCMNCKGDTSASTEGKIRQVFANMQPGTLVALTNVESLSEDREGTNDPRVFAALQEELKKLAILNPRPFIIGTAKDQNNLSDDLWSLFTYPLTIHYPKKEERSDTLYWLLGAYFGLDFIPTNSTIFESIENILKIISHRTAGFNYGDLEELIIRVQRYFKEMQAHHPKSMSNSLFDSNNLPSLEDFMVILNEMQKQRSEALGLPRIPTVNWKDIGGLEEAKIELINTIQLPIKHPTLISTTIRRTGILLYGPPGTGKTLLAKSVASECGLNFLSIKGPELINMYVGQSEENVRKVFIKAKSAAPCVIFFDELDSLAPNRGKSGDSGGVMDRIVSSLLAELDGVTATTDVFVLAATNRPDLLDPALLRPGRFEKQIYLGLSENREDQLKILKAVTSKIPLCDEVQLSNIVEHLPFTLTGADFSALAADAFYIATRRVIKNIETGEDSADTASVNVTEEDFVIAAEKLIPSVSSSELALYKSMNLKLKGL